MFVLFLFFLFFFYFMFFVFVFLQKGNTMFVRFIQIYRKYHISMYFLRQIIFHFPSEEKNIFPDNKGKMIFQWDFFGNTIFPEYLRKISYFHEFFFWESSSFIFRPKNKMIFSGKWNIIFPDNTGMVIFQWNLFQNTIFSEHLEKNMIFRGVNVHYFLVLYYLEDLHIF